jgi:ABC-2 type transport system permease protein
MVSATQSEVWNRDLLNRLLGRLSFSKGPLLPSHWVTCGLQAAGRGQAGTAAFFLALMWSNGLLVYLLTAWLSSHLYRRGFNRVATGGSLRRHYGGLEIDRVLDFFLQFLSPQVRLLIIKDFRTFRRDPAQWTQIAIISGLMTLYLTNIRRLYIGEIGWKYQNGISLLNLAVCSTWQRRVCSWLPTREDSSIPS